MPVFDWDNEKATSNLVKHGVPFPYATRAFSDPQKIELPDKRYDYGEERFKIIAVVEEFVIAVIFTRRGEDIRIISARPASREERAQYRSVRS